MRCQREGGLSATTQVKVLSPEIDNIAQGQGFHFLEASIAVCVKGEYVCDVPGSESVAGKLTVHIGTWENITPTKLALISERARKEPKLQFISLAHLLNERFLKECYYSLGRDQASGITLSPVV